MRFWCLILALASNFLFIDGDDESRCKLELERGPCCVRMTRYYYNKNLRICQSFSYGGRGGNANRFSSLVACQKTCMDICKLPKYERYSPTYFVRYFYDNKDRTCKVFSSGLNGFQNANNFETIGECLDTCICKLAWDSGNGTEKERRFYFDTQQQECLPTFFSGEGGNANNFKGKQECISTCVCNLPKNVGDGSESYPGYYFNAKTQTCDRFVFKGSGGNSNHFQRRSECNWPCICSQAADPGPGITFSIKYHLNPKTKRCEKFTYGGQGGNANRFDTIKQCTSTCVCLLPKDPGTGLNPTQRYFFDEEKNKCEPFTFQGQGGNANNFLSGPDCNSACVCHVTPLSYSGTGHNQQYYFNIMDGTCKEFPTGRRGATANTFSSIEECVSACGCNLPRKVGNGTTRLRRYYFNAKSNRCVRFIYNGKNGNLNNFKSLLECKSSCACQSPLVVGTGNASVQRFFYDARTQQCKAFIFKRQGWNSNSFQYLWICKSACICSFSKDDGAYHKPGSMYYYNKNEQKCEKISGEYYGGNAKRFKTLNDCENTCVRR